MINIKKPNKQAALTTIFLALVLSLQGIGHAQFKKFKEEIQKINNTYDSAIYLSFDVKYTYHTDTVSNRSKQTEMAGKYTLNGAKASYQVGNIEYVRNDSFSIAAYNDQAFLMVTKLGNAKNKSSATLPIKAIMDTMFLGLSQHYTVSSTTRWERGDSIRYVHFKRIAGDSTAPYDFMSVSYNARSYFLRSLEYGFRQYVENDGTDTSGPAPAPGEVVTAPIPKKWRVRFGIQFSNYHMEALDPTIFSETRFITPTAAGKWKAVGKYKGYKLYLSGK